MGITPKVGRLVARAYTLPRAGPSTLLGTVSLGQLNARSGRNMKIAEDILVALGILLPYVMSPMAGISWWNSPSGPTM